MLVNAACIPGLSIDGDYAALLQLIVGSIVICSMRELEVRLYLAFLVDQTNLTAGTLTWSAVPEQTESHQDRSGDAQAC